MNKFACSRDYREVFLILFISIMLVLPVTSTGAGPVNTLIGISNPNVTLVRTIASDNITDLSADFLLAGDFIIWRNTDSAGPSTAPGGVYLYSLRDNSTRRISGNSGEGRWIQGLAMTEDRVVWHEYPGTLYLYTIGNGTTIPIPSPGTGGFQKIYSKNGIQEIARWMPSMDGDRIVWLQGFSSNTYGDSDICIENITENFIRPIHASSSAKSGLVIHGNHVAWYSYRDTQEGKDTSIYLYNISIGEEKAICTDSGVHTQTAMSDHSLAWTDFGNPLDLPAPLSRIVLYNLSSGAVQTIPGAGTSQSDPIFAGDLMAYTECTPFDKSGNSRNCVSKLFDSTYGTIWELPGSGPTRDSGEYEYSRKILAYDKGRFLIEDIQNGNRVLGLYRFESISKPEGTIPSTAREPPRETRTILEPVASTVPHTPAAPGFPVTECILAVVVMAAAARWLTN